MNNMKDVLLSFINDDLSIDQMFTKYISLDGDKSEVNKLILKSGLDELCKFIDLSIYFGDQVCKKYEFHILNVMYDELFSLISKKERRNILTEKLIDVNNLTLDNLGFTIRITIKNEDKFGKKSGRLIISKLETILNRIIYPLVQKSPHDIDYFVKKLGSIDNLFRLVTFDICKIVEEKNKSRKNYYIVEIL